LFEFTDKTKEDKIKKCEILLVYILFFYSQQILLISNNVKKCVEYLETKYYPNCYREECSPTDLENFRTNLKECHGKFFAI
jgi:hypothetical protein